MENAIFYSEQMLLRFDSYENRVARGKVQAICYRTPFQFDSLDQLIMIMDDVLDSICFPRREGDLRHIDKKDGGQPGVFRKIDQADHIEDEWKSPGVSGFHGQATVVVNRRDHSSMQGTLVVDGERINFRSVLELMHMLHEYLEKSFG